MPAQFYEKPIEATPVKYEQSPTKIVLEYPREQASRDKSANQKRRVIITNTYQSANVSINNEVMVPVEKPLSRRTIELS